MMCHEYVSRIHRPTRMFATGEAPDHPSKLHFLWFHTDEQSPSRRALRSRTLTVTQARWIRPRAWTIPRACRGPWPEVNGASRQGRRRTRSMLGLSGLNEDAKTFRSGSTKYYKKSEVKGQKPSVLHVVDSSDC